MPRKVSGLSVESVPAVEIGRRRRVGETAPEGRQHRGRDLKAEERQAVVGEERLDVRQREAVLHDVEQQVAAAAGAVEIAQRGQAFFERAILATMDLLAAGANSLRRRRVAAPGDQRAPRDDAAARDLAVEPDPHDPARPQPRQQHAPARFRIRQMMQNADRLDVVEGALDGAEVDDVGLRIVQILNAGLAGFPPRIGEAGEADVDGEDARLRIEQGRVDRVLSGATAGDQDILDGRAVGRARRRHLHGRDRGPARIGVLFVLPAHLQRNFVADFRERRDQGAVAQLLQGFADLLLQQLGDCVRPRARQQ